MSIAPKRRLFYPSVNTYKIRSCREHPFKGDSQTGFTLIEVMVALAILAVVAVAASRASSAYLNSVDVLRTRTLAHFVVQNAAADLRIQKTWLSANRTQAVSEQGREWQITMTVSNSVTPALSNVNIAVAPIIDGQTGNAVTDIDVVLADSQQDDPALDFGPMGGQS